MTQDMTNAGTGRDVVYTLKVITDPNAKAELQKFKQSVQEVFKEIGAKQAEARDQAMRGPRINIERMRSQVQQETQQRQLGSFQPAEQNNSRFSFPGQQAISSLSGPTLSLVQNDDNPVSDSPSTHFAPLFSASPRSSPFHIKPAGNLGPTSSSRHTSSDRNSTDLQQSISSVINALSKLAQSLGAADVHSRRNSLLQRANRDAAFG